MIRTLSRLDNCMIFRKELPKARDWLLALLTLGLLAGCATTDTGPAPADSGEIVKSPNDKREYRHLVLDNGLRVVLISDLETDKSAASLSVFRGSFDDPEDRPGLAHFLEHMLFIGTEKYPETDGYFKFVQSHGGSSNAYTASEHTNYFFDIQPAFFRQGLDRFAQFFISPLFNKEYVEREKNAVHSEYQLQIKDDSWRGFAVQKVMFNPEHPMSKFNIGTLDTLSGDVHSSLLDFFEKQYSANQMGLVVLTNETLDEMEPWVTEMFAPIENRQLAPIERTAPLFTEGALPGTLRYQNLKANHELSFAFPIPSQLPYYRSKPANYIANLLGHEGEGSLHKALTEKGWITSLGAGDFNVDPNNSLMYINLELTEDGAGKTEEITRFVFDYLALLRASDVEAWRYEEQASVAEIGFRFAEKSQAMGVVSGMSPALQHYPAEDLLVAPYLMEEFDKELIASFIDVLTEDNAMVAIAGPGYDGSQTEKWFSVKYDVETGPVAVADIETAGLGLPEPNPFLPENLDLLEAGDGKPVVVVEKDAKAVYLDTDVEFGVPRAVVHVSVRNDGGLVGLQDSVNAALYSSLVQDSLNALAYPAYLAGVSYSLATPPKGFRLSVGGYADKQLVLLSDVLDRFVGLEIDPERFRVLKSEYVRNLRNSFKDRPYEQGMSRLRSQIINSSWTAEAQLEALEPLTLQQLIAWRKQVLAKNAVEALIVGNADEQRARALADLLEKHLNVAEVNVVGASNVEVDGVTEVNLEVEHNDAAMVLYVQAEEDGFVERARSGLLAHLIRPGYFATLRTDQQLGYVVAALPVVYQNRGGVGFVVQSPVAPPEVLKIRTLEFLATEVGRITDMGEEEFADNKQGLITRLTQKDTNLSGRALRYWADLDLGVMTFDSNMQIAAEVDKLSKADMLAELDSLIGKLEDEYVMIFSEGKFAEAAGG